MLDDGCSFREISRTLGINRDTISAFPGRGWTLSQSASFGQAIRRRHPGCSIRGCDTQEDSMTNHTPRAASPKSTSTDPSKELTMNEKTSEPTMHVGVCDDCATIFAVWPHPERQAPVPVPSQWEHFASTCTVCDGNVEWLETNTPVSEYLKRGY
ncbi:hypothetical protein [Gordonia sihwensis]|uniref:hypothetical protein n=1 Tax=Gordonia sihwensis TaxID=173559 RepID=UPI000A7D0FBA|nr:hypothetical protein [Gordonia sihwensis]